MREKTRHTIEMYILSIHSSIYSATMYFLKGVQGRATQGALNACMDIGRLVNGVENQCGVGRGGKEDELAFG